jgi:SAM-dependent methyltransferase
MDLDTLLRASPAFSLALMPDGRCYVAQETEPYLQYWLSDRERRLWAAFSGRRGARPAAVIQALAGGTPAAERGRLLQAIAGMVEAGVLAAPSDSSSRYDTAMVRPYLEHRPFPPEITAEIVQRGGLGDGSAVLDLAGGPGDLALQLVQRGADVSLMDWSSAFLTAARHRARAQGVALHTVQESCNRLVYDDGSYDALTISQALHWMDDVRVCRGVLRVLRPGGSFFVVHSAFDVPDEHPLADVLGHNSILGAKARRSFATEVQALHDRVKLLFQALDTVGIERIDPTQATHRLPAIQTAWLSMYRQHRPLGLGFLRGLLTARHLTEVGLDPAVFWRSAEARCRAAEPAELVGTHDWALIHFARRPGPPVKVRAAATPVQVIGCSAPG